MANDVVDITDNDDTEQARQRIDAASGSCPKPLKKYGDKLPLLSNFLSYLGRVNGGLAVDGLVEVESQSDYAGRRHSTCLRVRVKNRWTRRRRMFVMGSRQVRQPVSEPIRDPVSARVPALDQ
jgi:hypothetical protein